MKYDKKRKRRKKTHKKQWLILVSIVIVGGIGGILWGVFFKTPLLMGSPPSFEEPPNPIISMGELSSEGAILYNLEDERIVFEKNMGESVYPASLTKVMTAVVALENLGDLEGAAVVTEGTMAKIQTEGASVAGFSAGEEVRIKDLLYGLILPSGADAALTLANVISGSEEGFVALMNAKAKELGMDNTYFSTTTGLQETSQVTTPEDLMKLLQYALSNPQFKEVWESMYYTVGATNINSQGIPLKSTILSRIPYLEGATILGGKTGFTDEAGLCLFLTYQKDEKTYLLVMTGCPGTPDNSWLQQQDINYMNGYI